MQLRWQALLVLCLFAGCDSFAAGNTAQQATPTAQPSATPTAVATLIPTVEATPEDTDTLTIWLPDALIPPTTEDGTTDLLNQQIAAFAASMEVTVEIRRKAVRDAGGIMSTLRTAKDVAPGVLPDLTLVQREDLLTASQLELLQPMEGVVAAAIIGDLYESALSLGQVDGEFYGLPYALSIQHVIYTEANTTLPDNRFASYLENDIPFIFPASKDTGLNSVFLVQYLAAGGTVSDGGVLQVNEEALLQTLTFYEQAVADDIVTPQVLDYTRSLEYRSLLTPEDITGAAVVSSQVYMELVDSNNSFAVASIPTETGIPTTSLNGWMWIMTAPDPNNQQIVAAFLDWMLDVGRQGEYVRSLDFLPSQRGAFRAWYGDSYDEAFINEVMGNARLPLNETTGGAAARAMQTALSSVIMGEQTAEEATASVLTQLAN